MSFNRITIVGFLGRSPELKYTPQGTAVCTFSIATTEKRNDQEYTTWFRVSAFAKLAELANQYLDKGKQAYVSGSLRENTYTDRDGNPRHSLEVTASEIHFLERKSEGDQAKAATASGSNIPSTVMDEESPIPF